MAAPTTTAALTLADRVGELKRIPSVNPLQAAPPQAMAASGPCRHGSPIKPTNWVRR